LANPYGRPKAYVSFHVRISPELKEQLARKSFESGFSQASIVIAALKHYLETGLTLDDVEENPDLNEGVSLVTKVTKEAK